MGDSAPEIKERKWIGAMPCDAWIKYARESLAPFLDREVIVVSLIGKDFPNRKKYEELNDFLKLDAFPCPSTSKEKLHAQIYYSSVKNIVLILINSPNDVAPLRAAFKTGNSGKTFFEKLEELEKTYLNLLHFVSLISQCIVFMEPYPKVDMALVRTLKSVNRIRVAGQNDVTHLYRSFFNNSSTSEHNKHYWILERDGRLCAPKFLFAFQKTVIRSELGATKRKEIIDKLEESLEDQIYNVFKQCKLIGTTSSLGSIPPKIKFARLLFPSAANETILADLLDFVMDKEMPDKEEDPICDVFPKLINSNILGLKKDRSHPIPTLDLVVNMISMLHQDMLQERSIDDTAKRIASREQKLQDDLSRMAIDESFEKYSWSHARERDRNVMTKVEHNQRFSAAVRYLDGVLVGSRETAMTELRLKCDNLWLHGGLQCCEQQSATGHNCHLPVHPCVGDESAPEKEWEMHESGVTFISTCTCGRSQTIRKDPFSVKEANYDFYFANDSFSCCKPLERHNFLVVEDLEADVESDEAWHAEENWPRPGDEVQPSFAARRVASSPSSSEESVSEESDISSTQNTSSDEEDDRRREYGGSRRSYARRGTKEGGERRQSAISEFLKTVKNLETKNIPHTAGIPHSLKPGILPIFPSWSLTCIGPGSLYSHALGLRDQPNFKISSEFLLPVDIPLQVDRESWEQDLEFVNAVEGVGMHNKYRPNRRPGLDIEKVKLFVGFDYECPRGHRFFVDSQGEPLLLPKGHNAKEQACRDAGANIMSVDLPLRRQCTCRKLPNQTAQLMKVHIVTPKSPVSVTIDPKVFLPNYEGYFCTGEEPLKLAWAKYYILHLPFVYSDLNGVWVPPRTFDRVGTYKGSSIQVNYTPLEKK